MCLAAVQPAAGQGNGLNPALPLVHVDNGPNSAKAQSQHYVVLVSLDGFRWDYARRDNAAHLLALGKQGAWAPEGMLPSYPSLTFPNHFTIVTGLYPEHHGLVANSFLYSTARRATACMTRRLWLGRFVVQRHAAVESCREPGDAHRLHILAGIGGKDRRLSPHMLAYGASWLQLTDIGGPGDPREQVDEVLGPNWGTHLVDVNIALGNLVGTVQAQSQFDQFFH